MKFTEFKDEENGMKTSFYLNLKRNLPNEHFAFGSVGSYLCDVVYLFFLIAWLRRDQRRFGIGNHKDHNTWMYIGLLEIEDQIC